MACLSILPSGISELLPSAAISTPTARKEYNIVRAGNFP